MELSDPDTRGQPLWRRLAYRKAAHRNAFSRKDTPMCLLLRLKPANAGTDINGNARKSALPVADLLRRP